METHLYISYRLYQSVRPSAGFKSTSQLSVEIRPGLRCEWLTFYIWCTIVQTHCTIQSGLQLGCSLSSAPHGRERRRHRASLPRNMGRIWSSPGCRVVGSAPSTEGVRRLRCWPELLQRSGHIRLRQKSTGRSRYKVWFGVWALAATRRWGVHQKPSSASVG